MSEKKIMDEETKKILTGLAPFSIKSTIDFVPEAYMTKDSETGDYLIAKDLWPTFTVRPWNRKESTESVKALMKFQEDTDDAKIRELTRKAVVGWENLIDVSTMEEVEFMAETDGGALKSIFDSFPLTLILDISHKV